MKKTKLLFLLLLASLCLASCKGKQREEQKETKNAELQTKEAAIKNLTDLEIVIEPSQFAAVTEDQSWSFETDMNQNSVPIQGIAESTETTYINCSDILIAFSKEESCAKVLCDKVNCQHNYTSQTECEANLEYQGLSANGLQYYDGNLYYTIKQGGIALCKVSSDGKKKMQAALISESSTGALYTFPWLIHRGNVYFWNEGKGLYKVPLLNPEQRELIVKEHNELDTSYHKLKAYGSYLYFMLAGKGEKKSFFCRYNIESGQIEQFPEIEGILDDFIVRENKIYYKIIGDTKIYQYDAVSEKKEIYFELENGTYSFYADSDYIYLPRVNSEDSFHYLYDVSADVYTWEKEFVGTIPFEKSVSEGTGQIFYEETFRIIGTDSARIYYQKWVVDSTKPDTSVKEEKTINYINKSEISEGGTDMKTALEDVPFANIM